MAYEHVDLLLGTPIKYAGNNSAICRHAEFTLDIVTVEGEQWYA
jgi:hypothetical protein